MVAKQTFYYVDAKIFEAIWRWVKRRHPMKSVKWMKRKYFMAENARNWIFHDYFKNSRGNKCVLRLFKIPDIEIKRHIKIKGKATPFDPEYTDYFNLREQLKKHQAPG